MRLNLNSITIGFLCIIIVLLGIIIVKKINTTNNQSAAAGSGAVCTPGTKNYTEKCGCTLSSSGVSICGIRACTSVTTCVAGSPQTTPNCSKTCVMYNVTPSGPGQLSGESAQQGTQQITQ